MGETTIIIPFSLPATLLAIGWWRAVYAERDNRRSADWRSRCTWPALLFATISTIAAAAFWFSWNASGGSPHGLMPSPGLWIRFRVLWECSVIATFATVIFSRGKGRLLALFAGLSVVIVIAFLSYLEMILE
jgi:hypothetical protein